MIGAGVLRYVRVVGFLRGYEERTITFSPPVKPDEVAQLVSRSRQDLQFDLTHEADRTVKTARVVNKSPTATGFALLVVPIRLVLALPSLVDFVRRLLS